MKQYSILWMLALICLSIGTSSAQSKKKLAKQITALEEKNAALELTANELREENKSLRATLEEQASKLDEINQQMVKMEAMMKVLMDRNKTPEPEPVEEETQKGEKLASMTFEVAEYDFGTIKEGEKATHKFIFTNNSENDLTITNARGSCGCTVPEFPKEAIKPGEKGEIKVVFNSRGKRGKQHKTVTLMANTDPIKTILHIKGEVLEKDN